MLMRPFGRDERPFRLRVPQWMAVEKRCNAGLFEISARLAPMISVLTAGLQGYPGGLMQAIAAGHLGGARLDDVREPLLQGLIGGGMTETEAGALVRNVFDLALAEGRGAFLEHAPLAFEILQRAILGVEDEPDLGEETAAPKPEARRRSRTAKPASEISTPQAG